MSEFSAVVSKHTRGCFSPFICYSSMYQSPEIEKCWGHVFCATLKVFNDIPMYCVIAMVFSNLLPLSEISEFFGYYGGQNCIFSFMFACCLTQNKCIKQKWFIWYFSIFSSAVCGHVTLPTPHVINVIRRSSRDVLSKWSSSGKQQNPQKLFLISALWQRFLARLQLCIMLWI